MATAECLNKFDACFAGCFALREGLWLFLAYLQGVKNGLGYLLLIYKRPINSVAIFAHSNYKYKLESDWKKDESGSTDSDICRVYNSLYTVSEKAPEFFERDFSLHLRIRKHAVYKTDKKAIVFMKYWV